MGVQGEQLVRLVHNLAQATPLVSSLVNFLLHERKRAARLATNGQNLSEDDQAYIDNTRILLTYIEAGIILAAHAETITIINSSLLGSEGVCHLGAIHAVPDHHFYPGNSKYLTLSVLFRVNNELRLVHFV